MTTIDNLATKAGTTAPAIVNNFIAFLAESDERTALSIIKQLAEPNNPSNLPATAFNKAAGEARRKEVALRQYRDDVKDVEVKLELFHIGLHQLEVKYRGLAEGSQCTTIKLLVSNLLIDMQNIRAVCETTPEELLNQQCNNQK